MGWREARLAKQQHTHHMPACTISMGACASRQRQRLSNASCSVLHAALQLRLSGQSTVHGAASSHLLLMLACCLAWIVTRPVPHAACSMQRWGLHAEWISLRDVAAAVSSLQRAAACVRDLFMPSLSMCARSLHVHTAVLCVLVRVVQQQAEQRSRSAGAALQAWSTRILAARGRVSGRVPLQRLMR
jgi:hypothetical protein